MPIPIICAQCQAKFNAPDDKIGKRGKCPKCLTAFVVPAPAAEAAEAPIVPEILDDEVSKVPKRVAAKYVPEQKKPNNRNKRQVDESDYLTKVNGKLIALKPGQTAPPGIPRSGRG